MRPYDHSMFPRGRLWRFLISSNSGSHGCGFGFGWEHWFRHDYPFGLVIADATIFQSQLGHGLRRPSSVLTFIHFPVHIMISCPFQLLSERDPENRLARKPSARGSRLSESHESPRIRSSRRIRLSRMIPVVPARNQRHSKQQPSRSCRFTHRISEIFVRHPYGLRRSAIALSSRRLCELYRR